MDMLDYIFRTDTQFAIEDVTGLYEAVGWWAYTAPERREDLVRAIRNSDYVATAWRELKLVGLARCLSDDVAIVYIQDVLVRPEYQGHGLGTYLVRACLERYRHVRMHVLLSDTDPATARFYERLGFRSTREPGADALDAFVRFGDTTAG